MKNWFKRLKNQKGMTLVELLAVVVILGIVAAIAVPAIANVIDNSKKDAHVSNALLIINSAKLGITSNALKDEHKVSGSTDKYSLNGLVSAGVLSAVPKDPDGEATYNTTNSFVKVTNGVYSVYLDGSKRDVGTTEAPATEADLNGNGRSTLK